MTRHTDFDRRVNAAYARRMRERGWVRLICPRCGVTIDVADLPSLIAWCTRCPGRPELEREGDR